MTSTTPTPSTPHPPASQIGGGRGRKRRGGGGEERRVERTFNPNRLETAGVWKNHNSFSSVGFWQKIEKPESKQDSAVQPVSLGDAADRRTGCLGSWKCLPFHCKHV